MLWMPSLCERSVRGHSRQVPCPAVAPTSEFFSNRSWRFKFAHDWPSAARDHACAARRGALRSSSHPIC
eukprot:5453646-Pyramimonas_sp.AAC.1